MTRRLRIVHVLTRMLRAGSEENTVATALGQAAAGHEVWILHGGEADPAWAGRLGAVRLAAIPRLVHPLRPIADIRGLIELRSAFARIRPDVVHTHQSKAGILGRLAARAAGVPTIIHGVHILPFLGVGPLRRAVYVAAERLVARWTDAFINVSEGMRRAGLAAGVGLEPRHHVVRSGMDLDRFRGAAPVDEAEIEAAFGAPGGRGLIVMVAALEPRKRHVAFLDAFAAVARAAPDARLALLGEGPERPAIEARIAALGLGGRVALLGHRDDPERWIAAARVCALASAREGLPRVAVQYVAAGRPVVAADLPGMEEIVADGVSGFLAAPGDVPAMAGPILRLLSDDALAAAMGRAAAARDLSAWTTERMVAEMRRITEALAGVRATEPAK